MIYSCYPSVVQVAEIILVLECFLPPGELQVHEGIQALEQRLNESQLSSAFDWNPCTEVLVPLTLTRAALALTRAALTLTCAVLALRRAALTLTRAYTRLHARP